MSDLFKPYRFCGVELPNRFVRSATMENMATPQRLPPEQLLDLYEELARGAVGLIVTSAIRPDRSWDRSPNVRGMCIDSDETAKGLSALTRRVHSHNSRIAVQLGSFYRYKGDFVAPSAIPYKYVDASSTRPRALGIEEIREIVQRYGEAGARARMAGFDAVQVHAAHGFPLSRFLSPLFNRREDEYGGSPENRARVVMEIADEIHRRAGEDFPVFIKMNVADFCEGGMSPADAVEVAGILSQNGICAIEVSGGGTGHDVTWLGPADPQEWTEGYFREYAAAIRAAVAVPVILVGGLRDLSMMEEIVRRGEADLVAMSRPLIREPQIVKRWQEGDRAPSDCTSCNGCLEVLAAGDPIHCVVE